MQNRVNKILEKKIWHKEEGTKILAAVKTGEISGIFLCTNSDVTSGNFNTLATRGEYKSKISENQRRKFFNTFGGLKRGERTRENLEEKFEKLNQGRNSKIAFTLKIWFLRVIFDFIFSFLNYVLYFLISCSSCYFSNMS